MLYLFLKKIERDRALEEEQVERGTQNLKQGQMGARIHKPGDHDMSLHRMLNQLSYPGAPLIYL